MKIYSYLQEIQHAVEILIGEIHREGKQLKALQAELTQLTDATERSYQRAEFLAINPDLDDDGFGTTIYWDTYFGPDKQRYHKTAEVEDAKQKLEAHRFSISALAGSLLQYAKQGIALHFGKERKGCPDGRKVAEMPLHEIIWQGRNQAIHWEEGEFHRPVEQCFNNLNEYINPVFGEYKNRSMAYEVISLLSWNSFDDFANDMKLLGGSSFH